MEAAKGPATRGKKVTREETPWQPDTAPDGVDLGQIRSMLALTPIQRLQRMQDFVDGIMALRNGRKA